MITCNARDFAAAQLFTYKKEGRAYLHAVRIEPVATGGALLVATDGHRLICIHDREAVCDAAANIELPESMLAACVNETPCGCGDCDKDCIVFGPTPTLTIDDRGFASLSSPDARCDSDCRRDDPVKELKGAAYPEWRRVLPPELFEPDREPRDPAWFNAGMLADFGRATQLLSADHGNSAIRIVSGELESPALIRFGSVDFACAVLMPFRVSALGFEMPLDDLRLAGAKAAADV